jgi:hypothetical protein
MNRLILILAAMVLFFGSVYTQKPIKPANATYVGVAQCKECHEGLVKQWERTAHSKAWERVLIKNGQNDPECVKCHVTAFNEGGYQMGAANASTFEAVQCEACHGPGSRHIRLAKEGDQGLLKGEDTGLEVPSEKTCKKMCHANPHFKIFSIEEYWPLIDHKSR